MLQLITDSSADLPRELIDRYKISMVPLTVTIDGEEYLEGEEITPDEFCRKMLAAHSLPKTSQPPPQKFAQVFQQLSSRGQLLCLTISSKVSGTYQSACLGQKLSGVNVVVFDTLAGTLGHGLQLIKAAELSAAGFSLEEILKQLRIYRDKMNILILLDTLENLVKGGRLTKFQGTLTKMLKIKVLLEGVAGEVELRAKLRGRKKALEYLINQIEERCRSIGGELHQRIFGISHVDNLEQAEMLKRIITERYHPREVIINSAGATIATYAGRGGIIVSF